MDFSQYQPVAPPAFQPVPAPPKEKSYIHQPVSAHHRDLHDLHAPLSISIPSGHPELSRPADASMHPLASSSAFKAWESTGRHVHRQASNPGGAAAATHNSTRRHGYSTRRQRSIENMQDLFSQAYGGMYGGAGGGAGPGPHGQGQHSAAQPSSSSSSYHHHHRHKRCSTHSSTEVTV